MNFGSFTLTPSCLYWDERFSAWQHWTLMCRRGSVSWTFLSAASWPDSYQVVYHSGTKERRRRTSNFAGIRYWVRSQIWLGKLGSGTLRYFLAPGQKLALACSHLPDGYGTFQRHWFSSAEPFFCRWSQIRCIESCLIVWEWGGLGRDHKSASSCSSSPSRLLRGLIWELRRLSRLQRYQLQKSSPVRISPGSVTWWIPRIDRMGHRSQEERVQKVQKTVLLIGRVRIVPVANLQAWEAV